MKRAIIQVFAATIAGVMATLAPAAATPITYVYKQTSASVPDFIVTGTMIGTAPGINNQLDPGPYDFSSLVSLDISLAGFDISLSWFTAPDSFGFPFWIMGGDNFLYRGLFLDFFVGDGPIFANTDNPSTSCRNTGVCTGEGHWEAVPEPATLVLFGFALVGLAASRRRRKHS